MRLLSLFEFLACTFFPLYSVYVIFSCKVFLKVTFNYICCRCLVNKKNKADICTGMDIRWWGGGWILVCTRWSEDEDAFCTLLGWWGGDGDENFSGDGDGGSCIPIHPTPLKSLILRVPFLFFFMIKVYLPYLVAYFLV